MAMLVLFLPRVVWYIGYYKCSTFSELVALTTSFVLLEYHDGRYGEKF